MSFRSRLYPLLRLAILLLTLALCVACFVCAAWLERSANQAQYARAQQDAQRTTSLLNGWIDTRRQALRGMAALFIGSDDVDAHEFAKAADALQNSADDGNRLPLAYAEVDQQRKLRIVYSAGLEQLPPGLDVSDKPALTQTLQYATEENRSTRLGPLFTTVLGDWRAYHVYPMVHHDRHSLVLTPIDFVSMVDTLPSNGMLLRLAISVDGEPPRFVFGDDRRAPGSLFTIPVRQSRVGATWYWYWDVLPGYVGDQWYVHSLANLIRYGGLVALLSLCMAALILLELYARSQRREAELAQAHAKLEESEHHYRTLVDQMPGTVFRCRIDPDWTMLYLSPGIVTLTGLQPEDLVHNRSRSFNSLIHPDDQGPVRHKVQYALLDETPYEVEYRIQSPDGRTRWVYERGRATHIGMERYVDGVLLDISERKEAETQRENAIRTLRAIINNTPNVAIQGYDPDGRVLFWNHASEKLFGWSEEEAIGQLASDFMFTEVDHHNFVGVLHHIAATGEATEPTEWPVQRRDGTQAWTLSTQFAIGLEDDKTGFVCMDVDITVRKQYEDELRRTRDRLEESVVERTRELSEANDELKHAMHQLVQSEKLASLGNLVAGIAHELNTPLGNTVTVSSTLRQKVAEFETLLNENRLKRSELGSFVATCTEAAMLIEKSAQRASELISNFKQVAVDTASTRRRDFDLKQTVEEVLSTLRPQFKHSPHQVMTDLPANVHLQSYPGPLEQIITNLVTNSLTHAFPDGRAGTIRISMADVNDNQVQLVYEDDGIGIPDALKRRVFDPFFTTRLGLGGSGLGLYIVYNLVHSVLGGRLELSPGEGAGVRFILTLPRIAPLPQENPTHD
ncbi:PAS domain-containing sensor histidine kinase [Chitiniphilus eburneus]|uniref:histidine kinase n=1 Tax=Chitiniphilus eburneus TaxID=2571148 RepID=A0A4U0QBU1_9NEIS|nr:PAS domain-containing sensor histidine kinase [Chitiniphilus eburneus]TJZ78845.1 PAS domain S-box protein [Chitiniphilus eburneus]